MAGSRFNAVEGLTLHENAAVGIELVDADDGRNGNLVRRNTLEGNELGIALIGGAENSVVRGNTLRGNLGVALYLQDATGHLIENNTVSGVTADPTVGSDGGFLLEDARDNVLVGNKLSDTGDAGIIISDGSHRNRVEGNVMTRTGDAGVAIDGSDEMLVIGNTAHLGSDSGVSVGGSTGSIVRDNDVRFNPGGVEVDGSATPWSRATTPAGPAVPGFPSWARFAQQPGPGERHRRLRWRHLGGGRRARPAHGQRDRAELAIGTSGDGISVTGPGHRVADNIAHHNAAFGIDAAEGTVDGGGNTASGNGEPEQCRGVVCGPGTPGPVPVDDLVGPETVITSQPTNPSSSLATVQFTFTGTDNAAPATALRFECRFDPPPDPPTPIPDPGDPVEPPVTVGWEACASPTSYTSSSPGCTASRSARSTRGTTSIRLRRRTPGPSRR